MPDTLPFDPEERKDIPLARGVLDYFPAALTEVARLSQAGNDKHNPGEELHHARGKSADHADCIMRHLVDRGKIDPDDGFSHTVKVAWRALALLQEECEARGAPLARGARLPESVRTTDETARSVQVQPTSAQGAGEDEGLRYVHEVQCGAGHSVVRWTWRRRDPDTYCCSRCRRRIDPVVDEVPHSDTAKPPSDTTTTY